MTIAVSLKEYKAEIIGELSIISEQAAQMFEMPERTWLRVCHAVAKSLLSQDLFSLRSLQDLYFNNHLLYI